MSSESTIQVNNLGKHYQIYSRPQDRLKQTLWRGRKQFYHEFWALRGITLDICRGESIGIIGRNGSGKSTLLQIIAGTLTPSEGTINVNGRIAALLELGSGFNPDFTGRENVYINGALLGLSHREINRRFDEITAFADIGDFIDQPTKTYSSGMVVRLAFAVSVVVEPEILIVDEALAVGDAAFQFKCLHRIDALRRNGTTLLFVSHSMEMIKSFCQRALYLKNGQLQAIGAPEDIAELYLMDLRDEQRRSIAPGTPIIAKTALGDENSTAFGTEHGRILRAYFKGSEGNIGAFSFGEYIEVCVEAEFAEDIENPCVTLLVQDKKMLVIGGKYHVIGRRGSRRSVCLSFIFKAAFVADRYFITLRLEERQKGNTNFLLIEKQAGILSFDVVHHQSRNFIGMIDLDMTIKDETTS